MKRELFLLEEGVSMLLTAALAALVTAHPPVAAQRAAIVLELSQAGSYLPGDSVAVRVQAASDGYLLVLRADATGRVRVLFPLDPTDDAFVRGGRGYDILSRGDRAFTFLAETAGGSGSVFAALSPDPLTPGMYALNGHWDYHVLTRGDTDDEIALRAIAERMFRGRFEYDILPYHVDGGEQLMASGQFQDQAADDGGATSIMLGVGTCWNCGMWGWWGGGWGMGWGWGWGWSPVWAWGPAWGWGPGWGGGVWGGGNPGWTPGNPNSPERYPGLGPAEATPYRPRVASGGRTSEAIGVRGSLAASSAGYRTRDAGSDLGVRGSFASSTANYRGRAASTGNRVSSDGSRSTYAGGRGVRVQVPGRTVASGGRGSAVSGRGYSSPSGMGGRAPSTGSRGTIAGPRGSGYSSTARGTGGGRSPGMGGGRGYSSGSRGFSGGGRGFSGGGGRGR